MKSFVLSMIAVFGFSAFAQDSYEARARLSEKLRQQQRENEYEARRNANAEFIRNELRGVVEEFGNSSGQVIQAATLKCGRDSSQRFRFQSYCQFTIQDGRLCKARLGLGRMAGMSIGALFGGPFGFATAAEQYFVTCIAKGGQSQSWVYERSPHKFY